MDLVRLRSEDGDLLPSVPKDVWCQSFSFERQHGVLWCAPYAASLSVGSPFWGGASTDG